MTIYTNDSVYISTKISEALGIDYCLIDYDDISEYLVKNSDFVFVPWNKGITGLTPWNKGKTGLQSHSEETKKRIKESNLGKRKEGTSSALIGNKNTKDFVWYHNHVESILVRPNETPPNGYIKGRLDTLNGRTKGIKRKQKTKDLMSASAKERAKIRLCCLVCHKELPSNSLGSHNRFCKPI